MREKNKQYLPNNINNYIDSNKFKLWQDIQLNMENL